MCSGKSVQEKKSINGLNNAATNVQQVSLLRGWSNVMSTLDGSTKNLRLSSNIRSKNDKKNKNQVYWIRRIR